MVNQVVFWNERAKLGEYAGTRDRILKRLEIEAIASYAKDGMKVLDAGCGDGETAFELARRFNLQVDAIEPSSGMVNLAVGRQRKEVVDRGVRLWQVGLLSWSLVGYDLIYTERVIVNLPDWDTQLKAMRHLISLLKPGGIYVACESCQDGLDRINALRATLGLPVIVPPEHNRYLREAEIREASAPRMKIEERGMTASAHWECGLLPPFEMDNFGSTYYFLSRVVNAVMAQREGKEPDYESPINQLALKLPPLVSGLGQTRIWAFRYQKD